MTYKPKTGLPLFTTKPFIFSSASTIFQALFQKAPCYTTPLTPPPRPIITFAEMTHPTQPVPKSFTWEQVQGTMLHLADCTVLIEI